MQDFLKRKLVKLASTRFLVLDEADRMLDMGFLPTIKEILAVLPAERQTMFFSATMEPSAAQLIRSYLKDPVRVEVGSTTKTADHVDLHVYEIDQDRKLALLQKMLKDEEGSFLVFARTKHGADRLAQKLINTGANATRIHGNRTQAQRNQALRGFQNGDSSRSRRDRRGCPRNSRGRHRARCKLRSTTSSGRLYPSRGPHWPRGSSRNGHHLLHPRRTRRYRTHRKLLGMKLTRKTAPNDLQREVKSHAQALADPAALRQADAS